MKVHHMTKSITYLTTAVTKAGRLLLWRAIKYPVCFILNTHFGVLF